MSCDFIVWLFLIRIILEKLKNFTFLMSEEEFGPPTPLSINTEVIQSAEIIENVEENSIVTFEQDANTPESRVRKTLKSWVWTWFDQITSINGTVKAVCKVQLTTEKKCGRTYITSGSTGNLINHLCNKHQITKQTESIPDPQVIYYINFLI